MDQIMGSLLNLGIGGAMLGAFLWFAWHVVTKLIPGLVSAREADLVSFRHDQEQTRQKFTELLDRRDDKFLAALAKLGEQHARVTEAICERLEQLELLLKR